MKYSIYTDGPLASYASGWSITYINYLIICIYYFTLIILLALNLLFYSLSKFGDLETFEQLEQGHAIEKLHVIAGLKFLKKCFHIGILLFLFLFHYPTRDLQGMVYCRVITSLLRFFVPICYSYIPLRVGYHYYYTSPRRSWGRVLITMISYECSGI